MINPQQEVVLLEYVLDLPLEDLSLLEGWAEQFGRTSRGYHLEWTENLPEEVHADYVRLNKQFLRDLPLGGNVLETSDWTPESLQRLAAVNQQSQQTQWVVFLVSPEGERVGFTEVTVHAESGKAAQGMTGVVRELRGQNLGKGMKAMVLLELLRRYPQLKAIATNTGPHNKPMRHINELIGFKVNREFSQFTFLEEGVRRFVEGE